MNTNIKLRATMKTVLTILCVISAMCVVAADKQSSEKKTNLSEAELRTIAISVPDTKTASMLHSVAMATCGKNISKLLQHALLHAIKKTFT